MEIIFSDPYYDSERDGEDFAPELKRLLDPYDTRARVHPIDIGHGADGPAFLVQLFASVDWSTLLSVGVGGTFLLGKQINENIDAWIDIGGKLKKLIKKLSPSRIDEFGATVLVLKELEKSLSNEASVEVSVQIVQFSPVPWGKFKLDKRPDALYVVTVKNGSKARVFGIKSDSSISFHHEYGLEWYEFNRT